MKTLETLLRDADSLLGSGDFAGSLRRYHAILSSEPRANDARMGVGDALVGLGHSALAAQVYRATAWAFAQAGHPAKALVAAKAMAAIDPRGEEDAARIARLFAADSTRVAEGGGRRSAIPLEAPAPTTAVLDAGEISDVVRSAAAEAVELPALSVTLEKFAPAPLLSEIESGPAEALVRVARLVRLRDAEPCVFENEQPTAVYLVARGRLLLSIAGREIGFVGEGALLGEEPLVGAQVALASAWAQGDVDLLEIPYDAIARVSKAGAEASLGRILRAHFLQTLLRSSPLFRAMTPKAKVQLLEQMEPATMPGGATLVIERQPARGIWLVLSGQVAVRVTSAAPASHAVHRIETAEGSVVSVVGPGGIVGLASSLTAEPATATSAVTQPATGLFLPAEALRALADSIPDVGRDLVEEAFARKERTGAARTALRRSHGEAVTAA